MSISCKKLKNDMGTLLGQCFGWLIYTICGCSGKAASATNFDKDPSGT